MKNIYVMFVQTEIC